ncbi:MAG: class I mannose-6-phosphate isomerase [Victivallaceae bacterium]|nr:class I mannose-6-phosphate isomerase [Victivallaceae bacterium]
MCNIKLLDNPVFFDSNRVWRCYIGGKLLDEFLGNNTCHDGNFPEEWLASVTRAENDDHQQSPNEGLSRIRGSKLNFADLLLRFPADALGNTESDGLGVLCKFLDSAIRLPVQCHPDREFASKYCNSEYGKTESWLILGTRQINGESPYILLGFKPGVSEAQFRKAVNNQDIPAMVECFHKFPVTTGEVYFIPGRIPHAIGPGILLLEVQEPTDLVIQPEKQIGNVILSEKQMWGELDHDTAFSCFDYKGIPAEKLLNNLKLKAQVKKQYPNALLENIIGAEHTDCFQVDKLTVTGEFEFSCDSPWHLGIVTSGSGTVSAEDKFTIKRGDNFFISNRIKKIKYISSAGTEPLQIYIISKE